VSGERHHGLDLLRAALMSLGILLHVACSFQLGEPDASWGYRDPEQSLAATLLVIGIHSFRMPVFFVLSGFFAAMLAQRRGARGMWLDRMRRVGVPLLVGWLLLTPLVGFAFSYAISVQLGSDPLSAVALHRPVPGGLAHLWFLHYLLILCGLAALCCCLPNAVQAAWRRVCDRTLGGRWRGLALWILLAAALLCMPGPSLETPGGLVPDLSVLAAYGVCFGAGWQLRCVPGFVERLPQGAWWRSALGLVALALSSLGVLIWHGERSTAVFVLAQLATSATVWLVGLGTMGLCERWLRQPSRWVRELVDASYWIYLIHLPLSVYVVVQMRSWDAGVATKILCATLAVSLLSWASFLAARQVIPARSR